MEENERIRVMEKSAIYSIRPIRPDETSLLRDFLYEAIYIPEGVEPPSKEVIDLPELKIYIDNFGKGRADHCLVAEYDGRVVGAVWSRIMNDYGHIDDNTPSLSISLYKEHRNKGIGTILMKEIIKLLGNKGYDCVSLSVQKANYAAGMYMKLGFRIVRETDEEFVMAKELKLYDLRILKESDTTEMKELFCSTVLNINIKDYTKEEVEDWASCGENADRWKELISENRYIGAFDRDNRLVGFSSMNKDGYLHSMFVHKDCQGRGVATSLLSEVEKIAADFGVTEITSEVSITARPFFEKRGYNVIKEQRHKAKKLELTNFVMKKVL